MTKEYEVLYDLESSINELKDVIMVYRSKIDVLDELIRRAESLAGDDKLSFNRSDLDKVAKAQEEMDIDIIHYQ